MVYACLARCNLDFEQAARVHDHECERVEVRMLSRGWELVAPPDTGLHSQLCLHGRCMHHLVKQSVSPTCAAALLRAVSPSLRAFTVDMLVISHPGLL